MMKKSKNFAFALCLAMLSITPVHAVVPAGTTVAAKASGFVKGGSNVTFTSIAPTAATYKVWLQIPNGSTATNALYRVYPKGTSLSNTTCSATDASYPCFEIAVNQALNQGKWIQLTANTKKQWSFAKNGYVVVNPASLPATELLGVATVKFEETGYSKISNSGALLADTAVLGTGANNWACTRDNVTGLIWEVKTDDGGLRDKDNGYSWYNPNPATNGGFAGYQNYSSTSCTGGISCDTDGYVKAVNTQKLCGFSDWKMPSKDQLLGLVNIAYYPTINPTYFPNTFPNTQSEWFWSSSPYAGNSGNAWLVYFSNGDVSSDSKSYGNVVRLVRGGQ
jgi:hypothetical protein